MSTLREPVIALSSVEISFEPQAKLADERVSQALLLAEGADDVCGNAHHRLRILFLDTDQIDNCLTVVRDCFEHSGGYAPVAKTATTQEEDKLSWPYPRK